jgi:Zn-dependent alcohol dehydrogenase
MQARAAVAFEAKKSLAIVALDLEGPKAGEMLVEDHGHRQLLHRCLHAWQAG